ncbi:hypothetical protein SAMN05421676_11233 [Salinibacillus kushneri]|uniref:Uncharacterized protein n=1 Tax=Salinibacillus kushneri TaxID=237682 RepID=A0A1I0IDV3_9BACI|nr:hypothetical protein [Salinibacillus kushneri]SET95116.1 hypothetical protein SAMN05421676_11233 [Salinibacillus kushneri]
MNEDIEMNLGKDYENFVLESENERLRGMVDQYQKREKNHFVNYVLFVFLFFLLVIGLGMMM